MQFLNLHLKHPNILHTLDELSLSIFFSAVYHPQVVRDEKVSSALAYWEHGERDGITTDFSSEFCQGDIPS